MDIKRLKELNLDAISAQGRLDILKIQDAMSGESSKFKQTTDVAKQVRDQAVEKLEAQKDAFEVSYKDVRDIVFKDMKEKSLEAVDFIFEVGKSGDVTYYAVGLYDLGKAKAHGYKADVAVKEGNGIILAVLPTRLPNFRSAISKYVFTERINLLDNTARYGYKPLEIKSYKNFVSDANFDYNEELWNLVERNLEAEKKVEVKIEEKEEKKYVSTLHAIDRITVRPYNKIGYNNESKEGKPKDDEPAK